MSTSFERWLTWLKAWAVAPHEAQQPIHDLNHLNQSLAPLAELLALGDELYLCVESPGKVTIAWTRSGETFDFTLHYS